MKIGFYAPFKPIDHPTPSGDRTIGRGLFDFLSRSGHSVQIQSQFRTRWIHRNPRQWPELAWERRRVAQQARRSPVDLWLTYHTYYKSPDLFGPVISRKNGIPYVVFQGIYSTKRRKALLTWPGFIMNRRALLAARHVFTNRGLDLKNLERILPRERITYVRPGIFTSRYRRNEAMGAELRRRWGIADAPVILSAAMFRPDVKSEGLEFLINACKVLQQKTRRFHLVIAGDGQEAERLKSLGRKLLGEAIRFAGGIPPEQMAGFYSAGDIFAFPGIRESLGMVYLEAQACGLPVVAFDNGGIPEVVKRSQTGFLVPPFDPGSFANHLSLLLEKEPLRARMGEAASRYVRKHHDLDDNYRLVERKLVGLVAK